jgi:hypothetical protein
LVQLKFHKIYNNKHQKYFINNSIYFQYDNYFTDVDIFKKLISENKLTELHHESYGWIIYRYIKAEENNLSSVEVRTFFRDYMNLKNERPSMLHSMILNFALNYSKTHSDFKFYNFLLLWNPDNFRHEDLHNGFKDGKDIPSLISRVCREFVNSNTEINIEEFLSKINLKKEVVIDFFRETIFWNIFNAQKENKFSELWNLFEQYNSNYSKHGQSKWHSEILNLAERFMKENDEWRFLNFFKIYITAFPIKILWTFKLVRRNDNNTPVLFLNAFLVLKRIYHNWFHAN